MRSGELRHRVTIQSKTSSKTGDVWTDLRSQWAKIEPLGAQKILYLSAQGAKVTHRVLFREAPAVSVGQRFTYDGRTYNIVSVQIFDDKQEAMAEVVQ